MFWLGNLPPAAHPKSPLGYCWLFFKFDLAFNYI